jgi:hypothetical protein
MCRPSNANQYSGGMSTQTLGVQVRAKQETSVKYQEHIRTTHFIQNEACEIWEQFNKCGKFTKYNQ